MRAKRDTEMQGREAGVREPETRTPGRLFRPSLHDHGVGVVEERTTIEGAGDFPAVETSQTEEEFHFVFVDPANGDFGFVDGRHGACGVEELKFVAGIEQLFDRILLVSVIIANW